MVSPSIGEDASQSLGSVPPPFKKREVDRPQTRAVVPRTAWPNLKEHGKTCEWHLLRILQNLQRGHGYAYITEAGLRTQFCEDTGHMPGVGTLPAALERLERQGVLHQLWLLKGGIRPDGIETTVGMRLIRVAMNRAERQNFAHRRRAGRERTLGLRVQHRQLFELMKAKKDVPKPAPDTSAADFERRRGEQLEALEAFARELEEYEYPPPG